MEFHIVLPSQGRREVKKNATRQLLTLQNKQFLLHFLPEGLYFRSQFAVLRTQRGKNGSVLEKTGKVFPNLQLTVGLELHMCS